MGFRFRKSITIIPGIRLNLSKSGISTSFGGRGATINVGRRGARGTIGIPGTGLSYSDMLVKAPGTGRNVAFEESGSSSSRSGRGLLVMLAVTAVVIVAVIGLISRGSSNSASQTTMSSPVTALSISAVTTASRLNCRSNPSKRAHLVTTLDVGAELSVVDRQAGWTRVTSGNSDCWVASDYLR